MTKEETWDDLEDDFLKIVDNMSDQQKVLLAELVDPVLEARQETEHQTIEDVRRAEEATATAQQQTEEVVQTAQEHTYEAAEESQQAAEDIVVETTDSIEEATEQEVRSRPRERREYRGHQDDVHRASH